MKAKVPIPQVIDDIKKIFEILSTPTEEDASYVEGGTFGIDKRKYERHTVLSKLADYFSDKNIDGGYLRVDETTFVFTTFKVLKGHP